METRWMSWVGSPRVRLRGAVLQDHRVGVLNNGVLDEKLNRASDADAGGFPSLESLRTAFWHSVTLLL